MYSQNAVEGLTLACLYLQSHPGGLLFTKFGSNQTALLDLAFPVCFPLRMTFIFYTF